MDIRLLLGVGSWQLYYSPMDCQIYHAPTLGEPVP
jgi:hypothetical protein